MMRGARNNNEPASRQGTNTSKSTSYLPSSTSKPCFFATFLAALCRAVLPFVTIGETQSERRHTGQQHASHRVHVIHVQRVPSPFTHPRHPSC